MRQRLILFTRYPEPGRTKTRLIPHLGLEGATLLHRQLVQHTLTQVRQLPAKASIAIEIRYTGATHAQMQSWLGDEWNYQRQADGDLGDRMADALAAAFAEGSQAVVIIGTDCPGLDAVGLAVAFQQLQQADLVLGPATDGGYYLIGMRRSIPALFQGIAWGTDQVLSQTLSIAAALHLRVAQLMPLTDIDRPEDLTVWEQCLQAEIERSSTSSTPN